MERVPIAEAAERLGVSRDTLERLIRAGRLKRYRRFGDRKTYMGLNHGMNAIMLAQVFGESSLVMIQNVYSHLTPTDAHRELIAALRLERE